MSPKLLLGLGAGSAKTTLWGGIGANLAAFLKAAGMAAAANWVTDFLVDKAQDAKDAFTGKKTDPDKAKSFISGEPLRDSNIKDTEPDIQAVDKLGEPILMVPPQAPVAPNLMPPGAPLGITTGEDTSIDFIVREINNINYNMQQIAWAMAQNSAIDAEFREYLIQEQKRVLADRGKEASRQKSKTSRKFAQQMRQATVDPIRRNLQSAATQLGGGLIGYAGLVGISGLKQLIDNLTGKNQKTNQETLLTAFKDQPQALKLMGRIRKGESGNQYDAIFDRGNLKDFAEAEGKDITKMTIDQVIKLQKDYKEHQRKKGVPEDEIRAGMGAYQFNDVATALEGTDISGNQLFNTEVQDALAVNMLKNAGLKDFAEGNLSIEEFTNNLAKTFPSIKGADGSGMYEDIGLKGTKNILDIIKKWDETLNLEDDTSANDGLKRLLDFSQTAVLPTITNDMRDKKDLNQENSGGVGGNNSPDPLNPNPIGSPWKALLGVD